MKKWIKKIIPPPKWRIAVSIALGIFFGLAAYTFKVSNAVSYLSDEPRTCINCHIMNPQYATWQHSSHREVAHCNDCHVPQHNIFSKMYFKAKDGLRHATIFTLRAEPQVIRIKEAGIGVVQRNCIRCHEELNSEVETRYITGKNYNKGRGKLCWECHVEVPHGSVRSISATPNARVPRLGSPVPEWLKKFLEKEKNNKNK